MISDSDIEGITTLAWELASNLHEVFGDEVILEDCMIIAAVATPSDSGVSEQIAFSCSSAHSYVQEGLLAGAVREHQQYDDEER